MAQQSALVIGAGVAGIATACYLSLRSEISGFVAEVVTAEGSCRVAADLAFNAAGRLAAALATGADVPDHAGLLGLPRYEDSDLLAHLEIIARRSIL